MPAAPTIIAASGPKSTAAKTIGKNETEISTQLISCTPCCSPMKLSAQSPRTVSHGTLGDANASATVRSTTAVVSATAKTTTGHSSDAFRLARTDAVRFARSWRNLLNVTLWRDILGRPSVLTVEESINASHPPQPPFGHPWFDQSLVATSAPRLS